MKRVRFDRVPPCVALEGQAVQDSKHRNMSIHSKHIKHKPYGLVGHFSKKCSALGRMSVLLAGPDSKSTVVCWCCIPRCVAL